jgi:hypothetical protein
MNRRNRWTICLTLLFAIGQVCLPAALSIGDARASVDGRVMVAHVEATSGAGCRAAHPDDCPLCRYLTGFAAIAPAGAAALVQQGASARPRVPTSAACTPTQSGFLSRAPPAVLS